jgi:hypothetical protein
MPFCAVIPSAAGSPHRALAVSSVRADGAVDVVLVGEDGDVVPRAAAGFAERANVGFREARRRGHEHVLLLNDDTEVLPGAVPALGEALRHAAVAGAVLMEWGGGVQMAGMRLGRTSGRLRAVTDAPGAERAAADAISGAALACSVATWERAGHFDERYTFYCEDVAFCLRARVLGEVVVVREARVRHRGGGTRSPTSVEAARHLGRSRMLLAGDQGGGDSAIAARRGCVAVTDLAWAARLGPRQVAAWVGGARSAFRR